MSEKTISCTKCRRHKALDQFHKGKGYKHSRKTWCKECVSKYNHRRNLEKALKYTWMGHHFLG